MSTQNRWKRWAVGGAAALALTAGAIWTVDNVSAAGVVNTVTNLAQGQSIMTPQFAQWDDMQQGQGPRGDGPMGGPGMMAEEQATYLADALGITVAELQAAQERARNAAIDQAVTDGTLTQEQADQLKAGERVGVPFMGRGAGAVDHEALLADALGITVEALDAAKVEARAAALAQAVTDGEITQEQADLMTARQAFGDYQRTQAQAAFAEALQAAVTAGSITQAQADLLLENMPNGFGRGMDGFGPGMRGDFDGHGRGGHGRGGHGGQGRGPGGFNGQQQTQPDDSQTTPESGTIPTPQSSSFSSL